MLIQFNIKTLYNGFKIWLGGTCGLRRVMVEWLVGQWIVNVVSFQKVFGLYSLKGHIVEKRWKQDKSPLLQTQDH